MTSAEGRQHKIMKSRTTTTEWVLVGLPGSLQGAAWELGGKDWGQDHCRGRFHSTRPGWKV